MPSYPIDETLPRIRALLADGRRCVLSAPPGSGKTTRVPPALLDAPWLAGQSIVMLEPRRLATRAAAQRMAELMAEPVGATVGYAIRFERRVSAATRIEVVTEGILTRRLQKDPALNGVGLVIFDEFHERNLHGDLAMALCLDGADALREDLRILVMSATLDTEAVSKLLGEAPVVLGEGRSFPVVVHPLPRPEGEETAAGVVAGVRRALRETEGDILAFLPGVAEIRRAGALLRGEAGPGLEILPLYGDLEHARQLQAIRPGGERRRVVLATAIAETSLTIEGVRTVVDSGWSREPRFDPNTGLTRLRTVRVSRAAADQRAGRAGRLGPGHCYRLWGEAVQAGLQPHRSPEIADADLAGLVLELARWGVRDPLELRWLTPPPPGAYAQARDLLCELGALNAGGGLTPAGERMAALPVHPRLAAMMLRGAAAGQGDLAADLAALISERDIIRGEAGVAGPADLEERLRLLERWRSGGRADEGVDGGACSRVDRVGREWRRRLPPPAAKAALPPLSVGGLLACAYPDRIAQAGGPGYRYRLVSGRGVRLDPADPLGASPYLVVPELDAGRREGRAFLAAAISLEAIRSLRGESIRRLEETAWDSAAERVTAAAEERLGRLVLSRTPLAEPDPGRVAAALVAGIRALGVEALPWDRRARNWQARLLCLREWTSGSAWPDLSDEALMAGLEGWLEPWLQGLSRRDQLRRLDLRAILEGALDWGARQRVEELVPSRIRVPSGALKRIEYVPGAEPVLAVRLQEMFGWTETPRICGGRVPLLLHLLSPAQRPVQVTRDLRGFWERTYPEVRRELKGRYPRHYWPEDPFEATATARVRPRDT